MDNRYPVEHRVVLRLMPAVCVWLSRVKEQRIFRLLAVSRASLTLQDALWLTGEIVRRQSDPEGGNLQGLGDARWFYKTPPQLPMMGRLPTRQRV